MAFKRWARAKSKNAPVKTWSDDEMKIVGWCIENNIAISCMPDWKNDRDKWVIDIKINKNTHTDPNTYENDTVLNKIYEYYKYYYDKYRN